PTGSRWETIPPAIALGLLVVGVAPALAFGVGGVPHTARAGLAAGGLGDLATVAHLLLSGTAPYSPTFHGVLPFIYPPGILLFLPLPLLAGSSHFVLAFAVEILAVLLVGVVIVARYAHRVGLVWALVAVLGALGPLAVYRPDPVIGLLLVAAAIAASRSRYVLAFLLVFAAGLIKEYALVAVVPLLALSCSAAAKSQTGFWPRLAAACRPALLALLPVALVVAALLLWSRGGLATSQLHNLDRGVEIESLPAGVGLALAHLHQVTVARGALGSIEVSGPRLHLAVGTAAFALLGLALLLSVFWAGLRPGVPPGLLFAASIGASLVATPVLSPQYLAALTPCACLAAYELGGRARPTLLWGCVLLSLLTQMEFPYLWTSILALARSGLLVLEARNLLLLVMVLALAAQAVRWRHRGIPAHAAPNPGPVGFNPAGAPR
ncbi:MAG: hypothetical protein ACP5PW_05430, partial [Candidatus Dormibacteria bacterium]